MNSGDFRDRAKHIPIAREGIPYLIASVFTTLVFAILGWWPIVLPLLLLTLLMGHFFRDPDRIMTVGEPDVVSPAEGNVIAITRVEKTHFFTRPCLKISIFMSVFDVHVNRIPFSGIVKGLYFKKGRFLAANFARASEENEQNWVWIQTDAGVDIVMTQVAGLLARRIVCWPAVGDRVARGERFGLIRFGSRVDLYAPENSNVLVTVGEHVYGGETVLCRLR